VRRKRRRASGPCPASAAHAAPVLKVSDTDFEALLQRAMLAGCQTPDTNVLHAADALTSGERRAAHGHPRDNMRRLAALWNAYLDDVLKRPITEREAALMMALGKFARDRNAAARDNLVDIPGWARVAELVAERPERSA
jgi:hypothetical protein